MDWDDGLQSVNKSLINTFTTMNEIERTKTGTDKSVVRDMFNSIAPHYDLLNHLLTLGIDRCWRRKAIRRITLPSSPKIADIACGTADMSVALYRRFKPCTIVGLDLSEQMLVRGKAKIEKLGLQHSISFRQENCEATSLSSDSVDLVTVGFGIRNFNNPQKGLSEFYRVLKPNGQLLILEFSKPKYKLIRWVYNFYFFKILPLIGRCISSHPAAYTYLPNSVENFPYGDDFVDMMRTAGFDECTHQSLTFGIATIYIARKNG